MEADVVMAEGPDESAEPTEASAERADEPTGLPEKADEPAGQPEVIDRLAGSQEALAEDVAENSYFVLDPIDENLSGDETEIETGLYCSVEVINGPDDENESDNTIIDDNTDTNEEAIHFIEVSKPKTGKKRGRKPMPNSKKCKRKRRRISNLVFDLAKSPPPKTVTPRTKKGLAVLEMMTQSGDEWMCKLCDKRYSNSASLKKHCERLHYVDVDEEEAKTKNGEYISHSGTDFSCDLCGKSFDKITAVQKHLNTSHNDCIGAPDSGSTSMVMRTPSKNVTDFDGSNSKYTPYVRKEADGVFCVFCNREYREMNAMRRHLNAKHMDRIRELEGLDEPARLTPAQIDKSLESSKYRKHIQRTEDGLACKICGREYPDMAPMRRHVTLHLEKPDGYQAKRMTMKERETIDSFISKAGDCYQCVECGKTYDKHGSLRVHIIRLHMSKKTEEEKKEVRETKSEEADIDLNEYFNDDEEGFYQCQICQTKLQSAEKRTLHLKPHLKHGKATEDEMRERIFEVDDGFQCDKCLVVIENEDLMLFHINWHIANPTRLEKSKCQYCESLVHNMDKHLRRKHRDKVPDKTCPVCFEVVPFVKFNKHKKIHRDKMEKRMVNRQSGGSFLCDKCGNCYKSTAALSYHRRSMHGGPEAFTKCKICQRDVRLTVIKRHRKHHEEWEEMIYCDDCGREFRTQGALKRHYIIVHLGQKTGKFGRMEAGSVGEKRTYQCEQCGKCLMSKMSLKEHLYVHLGLKPYTCQVCKKGFRHKATLNSHMRVHTGEKPYPCHYCDRRFRNPGPRRRHMCLHTGERYFNCDTCGRGFIHKHHFEGHRCDSKPRTPRKMRTPARYVQDHDSPPAGMENDDDDDDDDVSEPMPMPMTQVPPPPPMIYNPPHYVPNRMEHFQTVGHVSNVDMHQQRLHAVGHATALDVHQHLQMDPMNLARAHHMPPVYGGTYEQPYQPLFQPLRMQVPMPVPIQPLPPNLEAIAWVPENQRSSFQSPHQNQQAKNQNPQLSSQMRLQPNQQHRSQMRSQPNQQHSPQMRSQPNQQHSPQMRSQPNQQHSPPMRPQQSPQIKNQVPQIIPRHTQKPPPAVTGQDAFKNFLSTIDEVRQSDIAFGDVLVPRKSVDTKHTARRPASLKVIKPFPKVENPPIIYSKPPEKSREIPQQASTSGIAREETVPHESSDIHSVSSESSVNTVEMRERLIVKIRSKISKNNEEEGNKDQSDEDNVDLDENDDDDEDYYDSNDDDYNNVDNKLIGDANVQEEETSTGPVDVKVEFEVVNPDAEAAMAEVEENPDSLYCAICDKTFPNTQTANTHRSKKHRTDKSNKCKVCGKDFVGPARLADHMRSHKGTKPFECPTCGACFSTRSSRSAHFRTHTGDMPYKCDQCDKHFRFHSGRKRHILRHHSGDQAVHFICDICGHAFGDQSNLARHRRTHDENRPKDHACHICPGRFHSADQLKRHIVSHSDERPFMCTVCGQGFKHMKHLKRHEITHSNERPFICDLCGAAFPHKETLHAHSKRVHFKTFKQCKFCDKTYSDASTLKRHENKHIGKYDYNCDLCPKGFEKKSDLERHIMVHKFGRGAGGSKPRKKKVQGVPGFGEGSGVPGFREMPELSGSYGEQALNLAAVKEEERQAIATLYGHQDVELQIVD